MRVDLDALGHRRGTGLRRERREEIVLHARCGGPDDHHTIADQRGIDTAIDHVGERDRRECTSRVAVVEQDLIVAIVGLDIGAVVGFEAPDPSRAECDLASRAIRIVAGPGTDRRRLILECPQRQPEREGWVRDAVGIPHVDDASAHGAVRIRHHVAQHRAPRPFEEVGRLDAARVDSGKLEHESDARIRSGYGLECWPATSDGERAIEIDADRAWAVGKDHSEPPSEIAILDRMPKTRDVLFANSHDEDPARRRRCVGFEADAPAQVLIVGAQLDRLEPAEKPRGREAREDEKTDRKADEASAEESVQASREPGGTLHAARVGASSA